MVLLDLGIVALLPREIAVAAGKVCDPAVRDAELRDLFERSVSLVLLLVPLLAFGSVAILALLPAQWAALRGPLAVYLALYVTAYPFRLVGAVLTGLQDLAFIGWMQLLSFVVGAATTVILVLFDFGLYALAIGSFAGQIVVAAANTLRLIFRHRRVVPRRFRWASRDVIRKHLSPGAWMSLGQLSHVMMNATDVLVVGRYLGPEAVLIFSFTDKTENILSVQPYAIGNLAGPTLGEIRGSGRRDQSSPWLRSSSAVP
jgi:O-antigen/teichoic acid export membrane protein